jgi:hypothetical protein
MLEGMATAPPDPTKPLLKRFSALKAEGGGAAWTGDDLRARVAEAAVAVPKNLRRDIDIMLIFMGVSDMNTHEAGGDAMDNG